MNLISQLLLLVGIVSFAVVGRVGRRLPSKVYLALWITAVLSIAIVIILTVWTRTIGRL